MSTNNVFTIGEIEFSAIRRTTPTPHWTVRINESGEDLEPGAGGISTKSVPKMMASIEELLERVSKGDVADFRKRFGLPPLA
jgi:hypothetical protein